MLQNYIHVKNEFPNFARQNKPLYIVCLDGRNMKENMCDFTKFRSKNNINERIFLRFFEIHLYINQFVSNFVDKPP